MRKLILVSLLVMSAFLQSVTLAAGQATLSLYPVADNYADSKYPDLGRYGASSVLYVGNSYDRAQNIWGSERIYIRFNLTEIPENRVIERATLGLWQFYAPKSSQTYEIHRVLGDWNETTQNWNNQPSWAPMKTSEVIAPNRKEVGLEWDITNDVQVWYSGQAPNYGTMIKVAKEETAQDASSGFWSSEYPVGRHEEWKPKLTVVLQFQPTMVYVATVAVVGLLNATVASITVDGKLFGSVSSDRDAKITFDRGTIHIIAVTNIVPGRPGVRYRCDVNETQVSAATYLIFVYSADYLVTFSTEPSDLFRTPSTGWYRENTTLTVERTGPDVIYSAPGARLVFDAWYLNTHRLEAEPRTITLNGPVTVEGRYRKEYYLNVTSPVGKTNGTGWYEEDGVASFSVDVNTVPAEGALGLLGLNRSFVQWVGSSNFIGLPAEPQGSIIIKQSTTVEAVWQDDWSSLILNVAVLLAIVAVAAATIVTALKRSVDRRGYRAAEQARQVGSVL
jgi:hypothetical protein